MATSDETVRCADVAEVEFVITGDAVVPSKILQRVGISASRSWMRGDEYSSRSGQTLKKHSGLWAVTVRETTIEDAAEGLLKLVEPVLPSIGIAIGEANATASVSIWWQPEAGQGGFTLASSTLKRLAHLGERVNFYFPG